VFGFLTVVQQPSLGLVGGYLLLNAQARPLEFHCTAPVRASRTQEILYGPTLEPFLYGEQIGRTLFQACGQQPTAIFTDRPAALSAAEHAAAPVWLVLPDETSASAAPNSAGATSGAKEAVPLAPTANFRADPAQPGVAAMHALRCGAYRLACRAEDAGRGVAERIEAAVATFDLEEPFERIRAAIDESQRGAR
jgi:hypothetical protein